MKLRLLGSMIGLTMLVALMSCQPQSTGETADASTATAGSGKIVYIRVDTLTNQYESLQEKTKELEARAVQADQAQNERVVAFQRDAQSFQRRANSGQMSPKQIGIEQERLGGREQTLMQDAERTRQELQLEQLRLSAEFEENLLKVLEEIQDEFNYDYILSYGAGTGVLMVSETNDITAEVVKRINLIPMDGEMDAEKEDAAEADAPETASE